MKATGVVRRIDDLGRIVIPIEIRRTMNIRDGDPLEIFVEKDGEVILKKYSAIAELNGFAQQIADSVFTSSEHLTFVTDRDSVVAVAGADDRPYVGKPNGPAVMKAMEERNPVQYAGEKHEHEGDLLGTAETCSFQSEVIVPIVVAGDPVGAVLVVDEEDVEAIGELEEKLAKAAAGFLARHMAE